MASFCPMASHNPIFTEFAHVAQCGMAWLGSKLPVLVTVSRQIITGLVSHGSF